MVPNPPPWFGWKGDRGGAKTGAGDCGYTGAIGVMIGTGMRIGATGAGPPGGDGSSAGGAGGAATGAGAGAGAAGAGAGAAGTCAATGG